MFIFLCLCSWCLTGVCGVGVKSVLVTEGDSVTLESALAEIQSNDLIMLRFEPGDILLAKISEKREISYSSDGRLRDRLKLDSQTESLIITDSRITDSGLYKVTTVSSNTRLNKFSLTVYARLPAPVISNSSSVPYCSVVCSVVNVSAASLSWFKGNSLLSSTSVSDLSISLSLPLEIDCLDDSYICVINNPISNETTHLNNTDLCQPCPDVSLLEILIISAAGVSLLILAAIVIFCIWRKRRNTNQEVQTRNTEITYADPTFHRKPPRKTRAAETDDVVYAGVARR